MKDPKVLAYLNLNSILANLSMLCDLDENAKKLATTKKPVILSFDVADGPKGKLVFSESKCSFVPNDIKGGLKLKFLSCESFNDLIDGKKVLPLLYGNILNLGFLSKNFKELTDILTKYLKARNEELKDKKFFTASTELMFYLIVSAIASIGNEDDLGKSSAKRIVDGQILFSIEGGPDFYIDVKNHKLTFHVGKAPRPTSFMIFSSHKVARDIFDGNIDAITAIASKKIITKGNMLQLDAINRIMGRISTYLK